MATQTKSRSSPRTRTRDGNGQSTGDNVVRNAKSAGAGIGGVARNAKGPALAGGAALAGLVGGLVLGARTGPKRVLGVPVPGTQRPLVRLSVPRRRTRARDLAKAAGQLGELASELRLAREELQAKRRRSPIEVVLDGLTHRPPE